MPTYIGEKINIRIHFTKQTRPKYNAGFVFLYIVELDETYGEKFQIESREDSK